MKLTLKLLFLLALILLQSCATVLQGSRTNLVVTTNTPNAQIRYKNEVVNTGAIATVLARRGEDHQFEVSAPGYETRTVNFTRRPMVGYILADILFTAGIGLIVDGSTRAWHTFDGERVLVVEGSNKPGIRKTVDLTPKPN